MEDNIKTKIEELEKKIDLIYISVEKTRTYFMWTLIATLVVFILPLIALLFAIPSFLGTLGEIQNLGL